MNANLYLQTSLISARILAKISCWRLCEGRLLTYRRAARPCRAGCCRQKADRPSVWGPLALMAGGGQAAVQVIGGADQGQVRKRLRKVPQVFAARSQFLGVEAEVVGISQGLLEEEAGLFQITGPRQALHIPERAHRK